MKDFCCDVRATNGQLGTLKARMKEWEDLSEYERKHIAEVLAKLVLDADLHS